MSFVLPEQLAAAVVLRCVADRITKLYKHYTKVHALPPCIYGSSKCLLPLEYPGSKWQNMVAFATVATANFEPCEYWVIMRLDVVDPEYWVIMRLDVVDSEYCVIMRLDVVDPEYCIIMRLNVVDSEYCVIMSLDVVDPEYCIIIRTDFSWFGLHSSTLIMTYLDRFKIMFICPTKIIQNHTIVLQ